MAKQKKIKVIVNGQPVKVKPGGGITKIMRKALKRSGNQRNYLSNWEMRDSAGVVMDEDTFRPKAGALFYLNLKAGVGGAPYPAQAA